MIESLTLQAQEESLSNLKLNENEITAIHNAYQNLKK